MRTTVAAISVALGLALVQSAQAIPVTTDGEWTGITEAVDEPVSAGPFFIDTEGNGTDDRVEWGEPFPDSNDPGPSAYQFDGVSGDAPLNGDLFPLGDFTHENFTIFLPSITGADLAVVLDFTGEGVTQTFNFPFSHLETANNLTPCEAGGANPCPDLVGIPDASSLETVLLGGNVYLLEIIGFSQDGGNEITDSFLTLEGQPNTATLYARLVLVPQQVPEPPTLALMGLVALLGWGSRFAATGKRSGKK